MFWTVVLEKISESPLDCKEIKPVNPKENQSWISIGRTDAEAETPILWPPDAKNWLIGKDQMLGKIEGRRRGWQRMRRLDGITNSTDTSLSTFQEMVKVSKPQCAAVHRVAKSEWITTTNSLSMESCPVCRGMLAASWPLPTKCQQHDSPQMWQTSISRYC